MQPDDGPDDQPRHNSLPARLSRDARRRVDRLPGGQALTRLAEGATGELMRRLEAAGDALATQLTDPRNVERLQHGLATAANLAMKMGFARDRRAERLFDLVDWLEQRHGRPPVAAVVFAHSPLADGSLLNILRALQPELLEPLLAELGPLGDLFTDSAPPPRFSDALAAAQRKLLNLLCELAALEADAPPPPASAPFPELVAYFEESPVPTDYYDLAALVAGDPHAWRDHHGPPPPASDAPSPTGGPLMRLKQAADNPLVNLLLTSYMFFFQAYTTRAMIERLPELFEQAVPPEARGQRGDDVVILDDPDRSGR